MIDDFQIYIDRLKNGETQEVEGSFAPDFLEIEETELQFKHPVVVHGEAYLTDDHLVIHLSASTIASMPCSICNEMTLVPISTTGFYHTEALTDIPSAVYDFGLSLREALLIELPSTTECNKGKCPLRPSITPFLHSPKKSEETTSFPFADIDLNS